MNVDMEAQRDDSMRFRFRFFFRYHKKTILLISGTLLFCGIILPLVSLINPEPEGFSFGEKMLSGMAFVMLACLIFGFVYWKDRRREKKANRPIHRAPEGQIVSSKWTVWARFKNLFN